jgi:hypothetical protein
VIWVDAHPAVTAPIFGARYIEQLRDSLTAWALGRCWRCRASTHCRVARDGLQFCVCRRMDADLPDLSHIPRREYCLYVVCRWEGGKAGICPTSLTNVRYWMNYRRTGTGQPKTAIAENLPINAKLATDCNWPDCSIQRKDNLQIASGFFLTFQLAVLN